MTIRNLDQNDDWTFGAGRQNYLRDELAIELNIKTRLKSFLNDCFWAMDFGIDWWNLLGTNNPMAESNIILQCRKVIADSYGVVNIDTVTATTDRATRKLTVTFTIATIYSRTLTASVQP